jgi:hypothetical protein
VPAAHGVQAALEVAALAAEYLPAGHGVHTPAPAEAYLPASHRDCTPPEQECPAAHTHSVSHTRGKLRIAPTASFRIPPELGSILANVVTSVTTAGSPSPLGLPASQRLPSNGTEKGGG